MSDAASVAFVVLSFGLLAAAHLTIAVGLLSRAPRWRAAAALVLPPLAPYWAAREHMWIRAAAWGLGLVVYVVARLAATS